jgi:hypothetical protein
VVSCPKNGKFSDVEIGVIHYVCEVHKIHCLKACEISHSVESPGAVMKQTWKMDMGPLVALPAAYHSCSLYDRIRLI